MGSQPQNTEFRNNPKKSTNFKHYTNLWSYKVGGITRGHKKAIVSS